MYEPRLPCEAGGGFVYFVSYTASIRAIWNLSNALTIVGYLITKWMTGAFAFEMITAVTFMI